MADDSPASPLRQLFTCFRILKLLSDLHTRIGDAEWCTGTNGVTLGDWGLSVKLLSVGGCTGINGVTGGVSAEREANLGPITAATGGLDSVC